MAAALLQAQDDALLENEVARVVVECGGSLRLGSFFLHRPDLKRVLLDRKLKDFLLEDARAARFHLEDDDDDADDAPAKPKGRTFGGSHGILVRLACGEDDPAVAEVRKARADTLASAQDGVAPGVVGVYAPAGFATGTEAARAALNTLHKTVVCEVQQMVEKSSQAAAEGAAATPSVGVACKDFPEGTVRIGFLASRSTRLRKKLLAAYSLAPNAGVMALFPTPREARDAEANRVNVLYALYLLRFFETRSDTFELVDGPRDMRCVQHHVVAPARCICNTYVKIRTAPAAAPESNQDTQLEERVKTLLKGSNPKKGVDLAWIGQDPKVKKLLKGRQLIACAKAMASVELFEVEGRWKARYSQVQRALWAEMLQQQKPSGADGDSTGSDGRPEPAAKKRKVDWSAAPLPPPPIVPLGAAAQLVALDKPPNVTTERVLDAVPDTVLHRGGPGSEQVVSISRLDQETSGVLVFATSLAAEEYMKAQYKAHAVGKRYRALCCGWPAPEGRIESKLLASDTPGKSRVRVHKNGKPSITEYTVARRFRVVKPAALAGVGAAAVRCLHMQLKDTPREVRRWVVSGVLGWLLPTPSSSERFSLLDVTPLTGRQHQIRVHMLSKGHPLVADDRYGKRTQVQHQKAWCPRNFLHCTRVSGVDVDGSAYAFESPLPGDLEKALRHLVEAD